MGFRVNSAGKVDQGHFAKVPSAVAAPRSAFDRSFSHKTTIDEGYIYPIFWEPLLPGDTVNLFMNCLARLATPIFPYMDNLYMDVHWFFVPNRLVWDHWEQFQGSQNNPDDTTDYEVPSISVASHASGFTEGSIYDYFGIPTKVAFADQRDMPIALPFRGYNLIWNQWYRDENFQDSVPVVKTDSADTTSYTLLKRNRRKDYFTSALPWPQKGPDVSLPLGTSAPIALNGTSTYGRMIQPSGTTPGTTVDLSLDSAGNLQNPGGTQNYKYDPRGTLSADLTDATEITINALRESIVLQQMLELDARGGTRYVEAILARFGVVSPDFRLQRPEYIGGQTLDVNVNPVSQTSESGDTPQGNLAGFAVARGKSGISYSALEHGQLYGLVSFRADTTYQQGLSRHFSVRTRYDYYEPLAANLGEQPVLAKELYAQVGYTDNNAAIGYQERWAEYRYKPSYVTGKFRSNATGTLDSWHLALDFEAMPTVEDLLPENPPVSRIVAVPSEPHFILDTWTRFKHVRVMPMYSAPGLQRL